jgi:hypothetical protein
MHTEDIFIVHPATTEEAEALNVFVKALKMKFEVVKGNVYDPKFVEKISQGDKDFENGNFKVMKPEDIWK